MSENSGKKTQFPKARADVFNLLVLCDQQSKKVKRNSVHCHRKKILTLEKMEPVIFLFLKIINERSKFKLRLYLDTVSLQLIYKNIKYVYFLECELMWCLRT